MKILIIRLSSIGDIVLTTPVVRCLATQLDAEVHYVCKDIYKGILTSNPYIYKVWAFQEHLHEILDGLVAEQFDHIIDLHKNIRSNLIKRKLGVPNTSLNKINIQKWLMVNFKINRLPSKHLVERYMETAQTLGVRHDEKGLDFFITNSQKEEAQQFLSYNGISTPFITIAIGAQHATKVPTTEFIIELCQSIPQAVILLGGPYDQEKGERIALQVGLPAINAAGLLSLGASAQLIQQSGWLITPDTGMMHIAAALDTPTISIWGSTIPEFGMTPYSSESSSVPHIIIENKSLSCRPCSKIGFNRCPKGHFKCMHTLNIANVTNQLNQGKNDINQ